MKAKKKRWKAFDLFTTEGFEMPSIRYLNKTGIGKNTGMVEAISENEQLCGFLKVLHC
jgi:hypothetical protein